MGGQYSRIENIGQNELLKRLVSSESICLDDIYWKRLILFDKKPFKLQDEEQLFNNCKDLCIKFAANNLKSGNFGTLLRIFLSKTSEILFSTEKNYSTCCLQISNILLITRHFIKYLMHKYPETEIIRQLESSGSAIVNKPEVPEPMLAQLIDSLIDIVNHIPIKDETYNLHVETTKTLLTLLSISQFTVETSSVLEVYKLIYNNKQAECLLLTLIKRFIDQDEPPEDQSGSLILHMADILSFFMPTTETNGFPLPRSSALLLIVLINHCTDADNVYRNSLLSLSDGMNTLFKTICVSLEEEETILILYYLLHRNSSFRSYVLQCSDIPCLVVPMLQTIYQGSVNNCHHMYMSLIILLILTEDNEFNKKVHTIIIRNLNWYTERALREISLGGIIILVTTRAVQYNLRQMRDEYLHTNCLAALANMSSQFTELHPYVCQRLVGLFETLAKTYNRTREEPVAIERALRIILEVLNSCLSNQLAHNTNLVYTLLYKKDIFESFKENPAFQDIIQNLDQVVQYFTSKLDLENECCNDVMLVSNVIKKESQQWPAHRLQKFPELKFKYVEEEKPEEFFIPYVWCLVTQYSDVYWDTSLFKH